MSESLEIDSGKLAAPRPNAAGVHAYKGIPYAAAPVGALRWKAPQPVAPWAEVRATDKFGPASLQGRIWDDIHLRTESSEDCLYLNVWTPAEPGAELPVFVWIHGGGFAVGSGAEPRYDGARLAARGLVVVTVNHRLNALGFLAHPELTREAGGSGSGNYGLLDLVAALQWVKRNIAVFGGDAEKVTIGGESAGSMAVSGLMASPLARGLFRACIGESGALFSGLIEPLKPLKAAERDGLAFMNKLGCASVGEMRALPAAAILEASPGLGFRPCVDGVFLPASLEAIYAARQQNDVALMAGWNKDEGFNFTALPNGADPDKFDAILQTFFGDKAQAARAHYPCGVATAASAATLGADNVIVHKTWAWLEAQKANGTADLFRFQFDRAPLTPQGWFGERDSVSAGAFHAGEINYVFDTLDAFDWLIDDADRALAKTTTGYWFNFIAHGDPNGPGLPVWPSFRAEPAQVMHLDRVSGVRAEEGRERQVFLADWLALR